MSKIEYSSAARIAFDALALLLPPQRLTVSQHAARYRLLKSKSGAGLERWRNEQAPYLVEPSNCLSNNDYQTLAVVGPGQCGKTSIAENWLHQCIDEDPGDMLWYMQTETGVEGYVKSRINPMIEVHERLHRKIGKKPSDDSLSFKKFDNMNVEFLSATENNLINKTARRIIADELDAYPESLGDIMPILDVRRQSYGSHSKVFVLSHPDKARGNDPARDWSKGIMSVYGDSTRCVWYAACPSCGAYSGFAPIAPRAYTLNYPSNATLDETEANAHLVCAVNGCIIDERERLAMKSTGLWVGQGEEIDQNGIVSGERIRCRTAGYWITGLMSPFILNGIGGLARALVKAERERENSGDDDTLRTVMVKMFGVPYAPLRKVGSIDANVLADRAEHALELGVVPEAVRFLTCAADVQHGYFEYLVRGWGEHGESWIIDRGRLLADPSTNPDDWDRLLKEVFQKTYQLADKSGRHMAIRCCGFDSGGEAGVTQQAYAAWLRWARSKSVRLFGRNDGREVYSVMPMKGGGLKSQRLIVTHPDTGRAASKTSSGSVPVAIFNPNQFKDDLAGQLARSESGPFCLHFPWALRSPEKPHIWFEQAVAEQRTPNGSWVKITPSARNEALDLLVATHVLAHLNGLRKIDWTRPPPWAAPWDKNIMVAAPVDPTKTEDKSTKPKTSIIDRLA